MAYDVAPILLNTLTESDFLNLFETKRIFNIIIAKLNLYENRHCSTITKHMLLFNNIGSLEFRDNKSITESVHDFFQTFAENYKESDLRLVGNDLTMYNYISVKHLYRTFVEKSPVIAKYENYILFYWNGQKTTINTIFKNISKFFINSNHLFALYDMHFKFYNNIAVIFLEIKRVLKENTTF